MMMRKVTIAKSRLGAMGDLWWQLVLECGHSATRPKRRRGHRSDQPAPKRIKCIDCKYARKE